MVSFEETKEDIYCDAVCDVLTDVCNLQENTKDIFIDMLEMNNATISEIAFARYIIEEYVDLLQEMIDDAFEIDELVEVYCDGYCDNCCMGIDE